MRNRPEFWLTVGVLAHGAAACAARPPALDPALAATPVPKDGAIPSSELVAERSGAPADEGPAVADEDRQIDVLRSARASFVQFIERAEADAEFAEAVARSRERIEDIDATIEFLEASRRDRLAAGQ